MTNAEGTIAPLPKVGIFACFSGASNTGTLAGLAALEVARRLKGKDVGICSLPALLRGVPRQSALVRKIRGLLVIDGCHNQCARKLLDGLGISPDLYLNLEQDLGLRKYGPFTSLEFTQDEVERVVEAILALLSLKLGPQEDSSG